MPRRTPESLADYLVVAVCPTLIMLLVGSLMFFLVQVFYQGQFEARLTFVLAMFVLAIVCVTRIAMEEGHTYATLFAFPLAIVVGIALARFVQFQGPLAPFSVPLNWLLMAIVWGAAHKLTWDCTLVDDSQDASGEGLLQQMGLEGQRAASPDAATAGSPPLEATSYLHPVAARQMAWWQSWLEPDRRPHTPGVWVVYFSLAALPLFGIGGRFIPVEDLEVRRRCFWLLIVYVASGMALLLATSFLNLRRYLRQRRLEMPLEMAATWIAAGVGLIGVTLLVASLVPRPSPEYSLAQLVDVKSLERRASRFAFGPEEGKGEGAKGQQSRDGGQEPAGGGKESGDGGRATGDKGAGQKVGGKKEANGEQQGESSSGNQSPGEQSSGKQSSGKQLAGGKSSESSSQSVQAGGAKTDQSKGNTQAASKARDKQPGSDGEKQPTEASQPTKANGQQAHDDDRQAQEAQSSEQQNSASRASSGPTAVERVARGAERLLGSLGGVLKAIFYLALAIIAGFAAWKYRAEIVAAWNKLLEELRELWAGWFGKPVAASEAIPEAAPRPRAFAEFADPFAGGQTSRMSPAELVRYTFRALEAWGRENGCPRADGQTPHEFAAAIGQLDHTVAREAGHLADLYARLAYAPPAAIRTTFEPLRELWRKMQAPAVAVADLPG